jgi:hypothetical protein
MARLRPIQWAALQEEFPDAEPDRMRTWAPVFRFWHAVGEGGQAKLASAAGLPLRDVGLPARRILFPAPPEAPTWPGSKEAAALGNRCVVRLRAAGDGYQWEVLDGARAVAGARFDPHEREPLRVTTEGLPRRRSHQHPHTP